MVQPMQQPSLQASNSQNMLLAQLLQGMGRPTDSQKDAMSVASVERPQVVKPVIVQKSVAKRNSTGSSALNGAISSPNSQGSGRIQIVRPKAKASDDSI